MVDKLKANKLYDDTLIIVASKHGQAPIDPTKYEKIPPKAVTNATKVDVAFQTVSLSAPLDVNGSSGRLKPHVQSDDIALIFLANQQDTEAAVDNLNRDRNNLEIQDIISRERLTYLGYGDPAKDPAVPDIIVRPELGVIYTTSSSKIAEHGGLSDDDR